jgi:hypothetical protein
LRSTFLPLPVVITDEIGDNPLSLDSLVVYKPWVSARDTRQGFASDVRIEKVLYRDHMVDLGCRV